MFGRKEKQQINEELNALREQVGKLEQGVREFTGKKGDILSELDQAAISASAMDQGLSKIVDRAREIGGVQEEIVMDLDKIFEEMEEGTGRVRVREADYAGIVELNKEQKEMALKLQDDSKYYTGITKALRDTVESYDKKSGVVQSQLAKMEEFAGAMSSLSLTAAVEAGRLGDHAMKFVRAADEVRELAEEYEDFAAKAKVSTRELRATYGETAERVEKLTAYLRDNNILLNKMTESIEKMNKNIKSSAPVGNDEIFSMVLEDLQMLRKRVDVTMENQKKIMEGMEVIGKDYITETESIKKVETMLEEM